MSNPEVEAAWIDGGNDLAIAAAREALAPLRAKHQKVQRPTAPTAALTAATPMGRTLTGPPAPTDSSTPKVN